MKNFAINAFNETELKNQYTSNNINIDFYNIEDIIFSLYNSKDDSFNITDKIYEREIELVAHNNDFITPDGYFYDAERLSTFKDAYHEEVDNEGNIKIFDCSINNERKLEKKEFKIGGISANTKKESTTSLIYLSDKDTEIYVNIQAESLYSSLMNLGLKITGFSGSEEPKKDIDLANSVSNIFTFNVNIPDKKEFIKTATKYLENKIEEIKKFNSIIKGYTINKLKSDLLNKIKLLDKKYGTEGKNILVINTKKSDYFRYILLLMHLENITYINKYSIYNNEFKVSIIDDKKEDDEYYDQTMHLIEQYVCDIKVIYKNNGEISFGDKEFNLNTLSSLEKNGIILLFLVIKKSHKKLNIYLDEFIEIKKELFSPFTRQTNVKMKTFKDFPGRWNKFARDNGIKIFLQNSLNYLEYTSVHPDGKNFKDDLGY